MEGRKERYNFMSSPEIAQGDIFGYGGNLASVAKTRNVGASTTPKASLRWQPTRQILLRGSFGQGFRAPSLQDLFAPITTGVSSQGLSDPLRCPFTMDGVARLRHPVPDHPRRQDVAGSGEVRTTSRSAPCSSRSAVATFDRGMQSLPGVRLV